METMDNVSLKIDIVEWLISQGHSSILLNYLPFSSDILVQKQGLVPQILNSLSENDLESFLDILKELIVSKDIISNHRIVHEIACSIDSLLISGFHKNQDLNLDSLQFLIKQILAAKDTVFRWQFADLVLSEYQYFLRPIYALLAVTVLLYLPNPTADALNENNTKMVLFLKKLHPKDNIDSIFIYVELLKEALLLGQNDMKELIIFAFLDMMDDESILIKSCCAEKYRQFCKILGQSPLETLEPLVESLAQKFYQKMLDVKKLKSLKILLGVDNTQLYSFFFSHLVPLFNFSTDYKRFSFFCAFLDKTMNEVILDNLHLILLHMFTSYSKENFELQLIAVKNILNEKEEFESITLNDMIRSCSLGMVQKIIFSWKESSKTKDDSTKILQIISDLHGQSLSAFMEKSSSGILYRITELCSSQNAAKESEGLLGLKALLYFVSAGCTGLVPQILYSLQIATSKTNHQFKVMELWENMLQLVNKDSLASSIFHCFVLLQSDSWLNCPAISDRKQHLLQLITFKWSDAPSMKSFNLIESTISSKQDENVNQSSNFAFRESLNAILSLLFDQSSLVLEWTLKKALKLLTLFQSEMLDLIQFEFIDPVIGALIYKLLSLVRLSRESFRSINLLAAQCLGLLGAIDPDRLPLVNLKMNEAEIICLDTFDKIFDFAIKLIENHFIPLLKASNETQVQDRIGFCLQEMLKLLLDRSDSTLMSISSKFSEEAKKVIGPYFNSKYMLLQPIQSSKEWQFQFMEYPTWCYEFLSFLVNKLAVCAILDAQKIHKFFDILLICCKIDGSLTVLLMPFVILLHLQYGDEELKSLILGEFEQILKGCAMPNSSLLPHGKLVFSTKILVDKWAKSNDFDEELIDLNDDTIVSAALKTKNFHLALYHLERLARSAEEIHRQPLIYEMQKIYSQIHEQDGMAGLSMILLSSSVENQILEHECCGNWSAAQTCYELLLSRSPGSTQVQKGFLECLKKMGLYETMDSFLSKLLDTAELREYQAEAKWKLGKWDEFEQVSAEIRESSFSISMGKLICNQVRNIPSSNLFEQIIEEISSNIASSVSASYRDSYDWMLKLHQLTDVRLYSMEQNLGIVPLWKRRLSATAMSYGSREPILNLHRLLLTGNSLKSDENMPFHVSKLWIDSAKLSRKSGFKQTAYLSILHASEYDKNCFHLEKAKFHWSDGNAAKAIKELASFLKAQSLVIRDGTIEDSRLHSVCELNKIVAKTELLLNSWLESRGMNNSSEILSRYQRVVKTNEKWEKGYFYLGSYQNALYQKDKLSKDAKYNSQQQGICLFHVIKNYGRALLHGTQYIYQVLPRLLTLWLDYGASIGVKQPDQFLVQYNIVISKLIQRIPAYQLLLAFPQVISRICHPNMAVFELLESIIIKVLMAFPQQAIWQMMAVSKSSVPNRARRCNDILLKIKSDQTLRNLTKQATQLVDQLISLCNYNVPATVSGISMKTEFRVLQRMVPLDLIIPIQSSFLVNYPMKSKGDAKVEPFTDYQPTISGFKDEVELLTSLQRPKKIIIVGSDGKDYIFLCKPKDDLRKDCRLMEFNSVVNRILKKDPETRKRQLYIRTFCVTPLNEECGLIEWVNNTIGFRNICLKILHKRGLSLSSRQLREVLNLKLSPREIFLKHLLPKYPPVFHEWFKSNFSDPSVWFRARCAYSRSVAVMSMAGFVLGLGDRHGENILFDKTNGDCVHVDFNCLFEKAAFYFNFQGLTFEKPEKVPFRLTHNMVDAFGISGIEGAFRISCENTLRVLRENKDTLMNIMETFIHDPLVEWSKSRRHSATGEAEDELAVRSLEVIQRKLEGCVQGCFVFSVEGQVQELISMATSVDNLSQMYVGWAPFM